MEKDKLLSYVDKKVKLVLFDGTVLEGVLCYESGEFNYYHTFSIGGYSFRWCEASKVKEVEWYEKRKANGVCRQACYC